MYCLRQYEVVAYESGHYASSLWSLSVRRVLEGVAWPFKDNLHFKSHPPVTDPHSRADTVLDYVKKISIPRKIQILIQTAFW